MKKRLCAFVLGVLTAFSQTAIYAEEDLQADDYITVVIEAESLGSEDSFKIIEDPSASGGKAVRDSGTGGSVTYDFKLEDNTEDFRLYTVSRGQSKSSNLSYAALDHFENYGVYAEPSDKWQTTYVYYGDVALGSHKIKLTSVREGNQIDKFILRYKLKKEVFDENAEYIKGSAENDKPDIPQAYERQPGSFYFEMENAALQNPMYVEKDKAASGGAYITSYTDKGIGALTDPSLSSVVSARFKFNVTRKGTYTLFIRYFIPTKTQKSGWFGIDDSNYEKFDLSVPSTQWQWRKMSVARKLDVGMHTFDFKYRQVGLRIDAAILTNVSGFMAAGVGSLPGEEVIKDDALEEIIAKNNSYAKLKVNNHRYKTDTSFEMKNGVLMVPATNVISTLGIPLETYDEYYLAKRGRSYLKFYKNSKRAIINGSVVTAPKEAYIVSDAVPMIPIELVEKAFDIDWEYCEEQNTLFIFDAYREKVRNAKESEISVRTDNLNAYVTVPYSNPDAHVEIYAKICMDDANKAIIQDYDGLNSINGGGYTMNWKYAYRGMRGPSQWYTWAKAYDVYYKDGAFHGSFGALERYYYDVKVRITDNGNEDVMLRHKAFRATATERKSAEDYAYKTNGELLLIPTFHNLSYYIDFDKDTESDCRVQFREKNTQSEMSDAYPPYWDKYVGQYRGSIVNLKPDTEYEVTALITGSSGETLAEKTAVIKTWSETPSIGKTIRAEQIYNGGTLAIGDIHGSPDSWVKIDGGGMCIDVGANEDYAVYIANSSYVIFENFKIRGGVEFGVYLGGGSHDIIIANCDIAEWGVPGVLANEFGHYLVYGNPLNYKGGIYVADIYNVVVERCYIHDSNGSTNTWDGDGWKTVHPNGSSGIYQRALYGFVARYNDIIGSDEHRFNDCMEGSNNGYRNNSGTGSDSDIYGNMFYNSEDDVIELDGGQMNVRFYNNHAEQSLCGVSVAPNMMGPSYLFNNLVTNLGTSNNDMSGRAVKTGGSGDKINGVTYIFNNTFDNEQIAIDNCNYQGPEYHSVTRNNILISRTGKRAMSNTTTDERDSNDYDLMSGIVNVKAGDEANGLTGLAQYKDAANGDYTLAEGSPGIDSGVYLPNFSDGKTVGSAPDMGALELGGKTGFLPSRPIALSANRYRVELKNGEEAEVEVYVGDIENNLTYSILKNRDFDWIEITAQDGTEKAEAKSNSTIKFKLKADMSKCGFEDGNGMVLVRLSNGFSLPIVVYAK